MPFNLQVPDKTAEFAYSGMSSIADTITRAAEKFQKQQDDQKAVVASAKHFDAIAKMNPKLRAKLPPEYEGLGAKERIQAMTASLSGLKMEAEQQKQEQEGQLHTARLGQFARQEAAAQQQSAEQASREGFIRDYAGARIADLDASVPGGEDPAALAQWDARAKKEWPMLRAMQANPAGAAMGMPRGLADLGDDAGRKDPTWGSWTSPNGNPFVNLGGSAFPDVSREAQAVKLSEQQGRLRADNDLKKQLRDLDENIASARQKSVGGTRAQKADHARNIELWEQQKRELVKEGDAPSGAQATPQQGFTAAQTDAAPDGTIRRSNASGKRQVKRGGKWVDLADN
jgi:hypothetical protein